jgi:hypothetical protein
MCYYIRAARSSGFKAYLFKTALEAELRGHARRVLVRPKRSDSILRLTTKTNLLSNFLSGTSLQRTVSSQRLRKNYLVTQNMLTEKIGNFMTNRRFGGYRAQKDKQKFQKFNKDMEKEIKKQIRQEKEKSKMMAKALKEEKAAKRKNKAKKK